MGNPGRCSSRTPRTSRRSAPPSSATWRKLKPEFDKRNVQDHRPVSVDPVDDHKRWSKDIEETQGHAPNYPMIGDPDLQGGQALRHAAGRAPATRREGRTAADNADGAHGLRHRPRQEDQADAHLPDEHRPQLRRDPARDRLAAAHGEAQGGDAGELEAGRRRHHRARRSPTTTRRRSIPGGWKAPKPYLRIVPQPN